MGYGGERIQYSPEWKGPLKNRSCTDWPCLIIFACFMAVWIAIGTYAFLNGDVDRLFAPTDSHGRKCGMDEMEHKPYLYFFDVSKCINRDLKCNTPQVCISECPSYYWSYKTIDWSPLDYTRSNIICESDVYVSNKTKGELKQLAEDDRCTKFNLNSTSIIRRCIPYPVPRELLDLMNITSDITGITEEQLEQLEQITKTAERVQEFVNSVIYVLYITRDTVILFFFVGVLICLAYIFLLRWLAFPFVIITIFVVIIFFSVITFIFCKVYMHDEKTLWLILAIIFGIITGLTVLISLSLLSKIRLACQLIKEASKAVSSILSTLLFPIFPTLMHLASIVYLITAGIYLYTVEFEEDWHIKLAAAIHIIGFIWLFCFITALGEIILAGTFATWYWTYRKSEVPFFTLATGIWRTVRYHLGTVAFGSLLITICRLVRYILEWIVYASKKEGGFFATIAGSVCGSCTRIFMAFIEKFLKFMNHNAYIVCAIYGKGLCTSASDALSLLMRNIVRVFVLNNIVSWLLFVGKFAITAGMAAFTWWYYMWQCPLEKEVYDYFWIPVVLVAVGAFLVANLFFGVYESAVDTIFLCFLEDCERHDGSINKPYYMSWQLRKLLRKRND